MKNVIATLALSLVCAGSLAKSLDSNVASRLPRLIDGSAYQPSLDMPMPVSEDSAVLLARAPGSTVGSRLPGQIDGSAHARPTSSGVSKDTRAEAASFDRLRAGLSNLLGVRAWKKAVTF